MTQIAVYSSDLFDRIADVLTSGKPLVMANASLFNWFAKAATYDIETLRTFHADLLRYIRCSEASTYLAALVSDFPAMFDWYGKDIAGSERAVALMDEIAEKMEGVERILPHPFVEGAQAALRDLGVMTIMEELVGSPWPTPVVTLVVARAVLNRTYVYPNTIVCARDVTGAEYVAMLAHEGTHIMTLPLVNDSSFVSTNRQLAGDMAEALAHAVYMCVMDRCGIGCGDEYLYRNTWTTKNADLILRLRDDLSRTPHIPLSAAYRQVFDDFATSASGGERNT